jgi:hypothetical protein
MLMFKRKLFVAVYGDEGGEGGGEGGGDADAAAKAAADKAAAEKAAAEGGKKSFTQAELDKLFDKRFAREKQEKEVLITKLKGLEQSAGLSAKEKEELSGQIEALQNSMLTKEQQAANEKKNLEQKWANEHKKAKEEAEGWKNRFERTTIRRSMRDAEDSVGVQEHGQLASMFENKTRLEEEKDEDGKPTGEFVAMLKFDAKDKEGKKVTFDLKVDEAFEKMRELGMHKNIFKHDARPGTGEPGGGKAGKNVDPSKMPELSDYKDQAEYSKAFQKWRDKYNLDGTERTKRQ